MNIVLISLYELGRQPFGIASPAAWLKQAGHKVTPLDLSVQRLDESVIISAELVAFYMPMHTATRIASTIIPRVRRLNPKAHLACYGLYATGNETYLREVGVETLIGGEFESGLLSLAEQLSTFSQNILLLEASNIGSSHHASLKSTSTISLEKQTFQIPDRSGLPYLSNYAYLDMGNGLHKTAGYTEATRGCKHLCRHCPIVPVYGGQFRVVQQEVVLADIRAQVEAGAEHISFGDPDFFNGPSHAMRIVETLHAEFPALTYDVTIKVEHLLQRAQNLSKLRETGCLWITSAVESFDDRVLKILDKGHTLADFKQALQLCRAHKLHLVPTFVAFHPWNTLDDYCAFLSAIAQFDLISQIAPIQYAIRLLIPAGSWLLDLPEITALVGPFDQEALVYPWRHPDPRVDTLQQTVLDFVQSDQAGQLSRQDIFRGIWTLAQTMKDGRPEERTHSVPLPHLPEAKLAPRMSENWYC
ncbi:radical SAM protein [Chloroflexi bacterium TSY]|nr:radical SAM protein [Chloroflexi bacterium TSY]